MELLVQKIRAGLGVEDAVREIVERSAVELRMLMFGGEGKGKEKGAEGKRRWSKEQAWAVASALAGEPEVSCVLLRRD